MNLLVISDIHGHFDAFRPDELPGADLVLFAGDLTERGLKGDPHALSEGEGWLRGMASKYPQVIAIPGNHDIGFGRDTFPNIPGVRWIQGQTVSLGLEEEGAPVTVHGINLSPSYLMPELVGKLDFMTADPAVEDAAYDFEPVTIVLSHAPPFGILDIEGSDLRTGEPMHIGSRALLRYMGLAHPRLVVCGHVHAAQGAARAEFGGFVTEVYNVAQTYRILSI